MSAVTDYLLSRPGLVGLWPLDEVAGATAIGDLGPNTLTGSAVNGATSQNALGGTGFVTGHTRAWAGGASAAGWTVASAATVALQLQSYALGIFDLHTGTGAGQYLLGRQNGWNLNTVTTGNRVLGRTGIAGEPNRTGNSTVTSNDVGHLLGFSYDGQHAQPWLDGEAEGAPNRLVGSLASFLNRVVIGGDSSMANAGHLLSVAFIFNRPLTRGEWATIYRLGLGDPTADQQASNFVGDGLSIIAATAESLPCEGCGYRRRAGEGGVRLTSPNREWHLACFGDDGAWQSSALPVLASSNSSLDLDVHISRTVKAVVDFYTKRPTTDKTYYLRTDGKLMGLAYTLMSANYGGVLSMLGHLHRRWASSGYSVHLSLMRRIMSYLRSVQIPGTPAAGSGVGYFSDDGTNATSWGGNNDFSLREMLPGIIAVWDDLDAATRSTWLDTLQKACAGLWAQEGAAYYANGNVAWNIWAIFRMMAKLDPAGPWRGYADAYLTYTIKPTTGGTPAASGLATCGLKKYVDGTATNDPFITLSQLRALNPASDKVYFTEANGSADKGMDYNYAAAQCQISLAAYLCTGDTDALQVANLTANLVRPRLNLTTGTVTGPSGASVPPWYADFMGGTRHNAVEYAGVQQIRSMQRIGRTDLMTAQQLADHWPVEEADAALNTTQQAVWYRTGGAYALSLAASPYWPGYPDLT